MKSLQNIVLFSLLALLAGSCKSSRLPAAETPEKFTSNINGTGTELEIEFIRGEAHNHPLMAVWTEDLDGYLIQKKSEVLLRYRRPEQHFQGLVQINYQVQQFPCYEPKQAMLQVGV